MEAAFTALAVFALAVTGAAAGSALAYVISSRQHSATSALPNIARRRVGLPKVGLGRIDHLGEQPMPVADLLYEAMARLAHNRDVIVATAEDDVRHLNDLLREAQRLVIEERHLDRARELISEVITALAVRPVTALGEEIFYEAARVLAWTELEQPARRSQYRRFWPIRFPPKVLGPVYFRVTLDPGHDGLTAWCSVTWGPNRWSREITIPPQHSLVLVLEKRKPDSWPLLVETDPEAHVEAGAGEPQVRDYEIRIRAEDNEWRQWARTDEPALGPWSQL